MKKILKHKRALQTAFVVLFIALVLSPFALQAYSIKDLAINLDAKLYRYTLSHSITDQVVLGTNGWEYFGGELEHYKNRNTLSVRSLKNIAHNVKIIQDYYESQGASFVATIAPNKSSLYDENMPYYYRSGGSENKSRIKSAFEEAGVNYVDLFEVFDNQSEVLYFDRDSHWNDKGAALVADALSDALGDKTEDFKDASMIERGDFVGDIERMINTINPQTSTNFYVSGVNDHERRRGSKWNFAYGEDVEDAEVDTTSNTESSAAKTLLMYRDSFANNLLPFFATKYKNATFTKMVPYGSYSGANSVILERSERQIHYLCEKAPLFESPEVDDVEVTQEQQTAEESMGASVETDEDFVKISSSESDCSDDTRFYVRIISDNVSHIFDTFWLSEESDFGWQVNLSKQTWQGKDVDIEVIEKDNSDIKVLGKYKIDNLGN